MTQLNFDANTVAPDQGQLDAMPAGWYNVAMDQSEMKPTKDGSGAYLECRFSVLDGQYAGRKLFARLNLRNANPVASEIAYKQLSAICHAIGRLNVQDSSELHNAPLKVKVKLRPADGNYEASNEISAYKNVNENVGGNAAPTGAPAQPAPVAPAIPAAAQPAPQAQPWQQAPQQVPQQPWQQPAPAAQPAQPAWQQPATQQPWQQAPAHQPAPAAQPQQDTPAAQQAPMTQQPANMAVPEGFNPQTATPPWQQPQQ